MIGKPGELICIEVKYGQKYRPEWIHGLKDFASLSKARVKASHIVYCGKDRLRDDGVEIWPLPQFIQAMMDGSII